MAQYVEVNGQTIEFPDGMPASEIESAIKANIMSIKPAGEKPKGGIAQQVGNVAAGLVRGAGSIGATLLAPRDALEGFIARSMGAPSLAPGDRRKDMDAALQTMGAQPDSLGYQGGKLAAEVLGTAGAGGGAANILTNAAPRAAAAVPGVIQAMRTGGLAANGAGLGARTVGAAASGAITSGLVNPDDALNGALIGGALPGGVKLAGEAGNLVRKGTAGLTKNTLGLTSGVGGEAVGMAYQAGKTGGTKFLDNMRGNVPYTDVLDEAKSALRWRRPARRCRHAPASATGRRSGSRSKANWSA